MAKRDYYDVLGIGRSATPEEVKSAYRRLARQHHPDVNKENPKAAEERFKEISEAYEVLADTEKRKRYDAMGFSGVEGDFGPQGFTWQNFSHANDVEDLFGASPFFQQFFRGVYGTETFGTGLRGRRASLRGQDIDISIRLPLIAAVHGAEPTLEIPHNGPCPDCNGTGAKGGTAYDTCSECGGHGQVRRTQSRGFAQFITIQECPKCRGTGRQIREKCPTCLGSGARRYVKKLQVTVPPGVEDGSVLRLSSEGMEGASGHPSGDLYIRVVFEPSELIRREGTDAYTETHIPLVVALLGGEVRVATIEGEAVLKIPAGTQPEGQFRLRGEGFPELRSARRGDIYVTVHVDVPKSLTIHQKEMLREAFGTGAPATAASRKSGIFGRRS